MVQYVITPWRNNAELLRVRQQLYSGSEKLVHDFDRRHAVAQVSVWMQRGNCPHLVESSAILTSAILNDIPGNSTYCVRAAYSAAFCRFVTGLLDSHQDKRRKLSMYSIAKSIGLPATYVELRHQATHEELPSLLKLRTATRKALQWIWDYYWCQLSIEVTETEDCKTYLRQLFEEKDEQARRDLAARLSHWGEGQLLGALVEIDNSTDDPGVLLQSLQLSRKILDGDRNFDAMEPHPTLDTTIHNFDDIWAELATMEADLLNSDEQELPQVDQAENSSFSLEEKPWAMWDGPWVPRPIGTID